MPAKDNKAVAKANRAPNKAILHLTGPHRIKKISFEINKTNNNKKINIKWKEKKKLTEE